MAAMRLRRDVWKLATWDPTIEWYARAIGEMQKRPLKDPTSWRYQAAIHEYGPGSVRPGDVPPSPAEQARFWTQCQHVTWFFLPWHRLYLSCFESIVADTIERLGGPPNWALPYWNYSDAANSNARRLPPAFYATKLPDGSVNPLRVEARRAGANSGQEIAAPTHVDLRPCLGEPLFIGQPGGAPGFGGPVTPPVHFGSGTMGKLEEIPHGSMHVRVGGPGGWMSGFDTAPLDPLFWLHHANIDRVWEVWRGTGPPHTNPSNPAWLGQAFEFHDARGNVVSRVVAQTMNTSVPPLEYRYEDVSLPVTEAAPEVSRRERMDQRPTPEMVGATESPTSLTGGNAQAQLRIAAPTGPARESLEGAALPPMYLNVENVIGTGLPVSHSVYVNVPEGDNPRAHPELYVGLMPMFGLRESAQRTERHSGSGLHYAFEISGVVRRLQSAGRWNPGRLTVTFVPDEQDAAEARGNLEALPQPITVGRISLYLA